VGVRPTFPSVITDAPMETTTIRIRVSPTAARAYEQASEEDRRKLDALLDLKLTEATSPRRSLEEVMEAMSREARERGLTPEALLREPDA